MPDLIIKPENTSGNKLILQDQGAVTRLQTDDAGITITAPTIASMANCTFPAGHIVNVIHFSKSSGTGYSEYSNQTTTITVSQTAVSFSATSGRKYFIMTSGAFWPVASNSNASVYGDCRLYYGTTLRSQGDTTVDTLLDIRRIGRVTNGAASGQNSYHEISFSGQFTAGSTATHYVYPTTQSSNTDVNIRHIATTQGHWNVTIFEIMP